jgi:hypothetical protein
MLRAACCLLIDFEADWKAVQVNATRERSMDCELVLVQRGGAFVVVDDACHETNHEGG